VEALVSDYKKGNTGKVESFACGAPAAYELRNEASSNQNYDCREINGRACCTGTRNSPGMDRTLTSPARQAAAVISQSAYPRSCPAPGDAPHQAAKRCRSGIDLIIMGTVGECA
jgi:hypothetical protein